MRVLLRGASDLADHQVGELLESLPRDLDALRVAADLVDLRARAGLGAELAEREEDDRIAGEGAAWAELALAHQPRLALRVVRLEAQRGAALRGAGHQDSRPDAQRHHTILESRLPQ